MIVFIGELQHSEMTTLPGNLVPLAAGYLASYLKKHSPGIDVRIFTSAEKLLEAVDKEQPDIVGLSVRFWSEKLSFFCAKTIKEKYPDTVMVAGGPSIDDIDSEIALFLRNNPYFDICIPNEGEIGLLSLVMSMQENNGWNQSLNIDGCYSLSMDGELIIGKYAVTDIAELPSPYLDGTLDYFLDNGFNILFQTTRG